MVRRNVGGLSASKAYLLTPDVVVPFGLHSSRYPSPPSPYPFALVAMPFVHFLAHCL